MPLSYLYVRSSIAKKNITARELVHVLPALLYLADYIPFLFSAASYKLAILHAGVANLDKLLQYDEGWFLPANFMIPFRTMTMLFYWILQVRLLASVNNPFLRKNLTGMRWLYIYNILQLPIFLPSLIVILMNGRSFVFATSIPAAAGGLLSAVTLFLYPRILYNFQEAPILPPKPVKIKQAFDSETIIQLKYSLEKVMRGDRRFLDPDFTLKELADILVISPHRLSAFINQVAGKNFSDYLNYWRIQHCLELIREQKTLNLNLHGVALKCGFNNRNTFSAAFKKVTGETPSNYLHSTHASPS
jgi:AraC-like DNA-binding protein